MNDHALNFTLRKDWKLQLAKWLPEEKKPEEKKGLLGLGVLGL